ncbi:MAG: hypothetical protein OSB42_01560 [Planctomycetota bacterium]|nr:hypothetical protein [Planctomycetota bacterium]
MTPWPDRNEPEKSSTNLAQAEESVPGWLSLRGTPRQVLRRLQSGDPLHLHRLVRSYIDDYTLLLDSEVVHDEVCVAIAESAGLDRYSDSEEFLLEMIGQVVEDILGENRKPIGAWYTVWMDLGMKPEVCWRAVEFINRLEPLEREVVHRALLDGEAFEDLVADIPLSRFETQIILRDVARALGQLGDPNLPVAESPE